MAFKQLKLWFDKVLAQDLAGKIIPLKPDFNSKSFVQKVNKGVGPLELKGRVELMADELDRHLADSYKNNITKVGRQLYKRYPKR